MSQPDMIKRTALAVICGLLALGTTAAPASGHRTADEGDSSHYPTAALGRDGTVTVWITPTVTIECAPGPHPSTMWVGPYIVECLPDPVLLWLPGAAEPVPYWREHLRWDDAA